MFRSRRFTAAVSGAAVAGLLVSSVGAPAAGAQELTAEGIIAELSELSERSGSLNEDVLALDGEVQDKEQELADLQGDRDHAVSEAETVQAYSEEVRGQVADHVKTRSRGAEIDPLTAMFGATDTQSAIDRSSYLTYFNRQKEQQIREVTDAQHEAAEANSRAQSADAKVTFELGQLNQRRDDLEREQSELEELTQTVRDRVDSLSPEQMELWRSQNNPFVEGLDMLSGSSDAVDAAMTRIGMPYSWGAVGPDSFDCSGLMVWAYQQMGKTIPRTSQAQLSGGTPVPRDQLQPGDIIGFYPGVTHVGMYVGDGKIVHASTYGVPVQVVSIDQGGSYQGAVRY